MSVRPNLADAYVHSARLTELFRGCVEASDVATLCRLMDDMNEIEIFMDEGKDSDEIALACLCRCELFRLENLRGIIPALSQTIQGQKNGRTSS